MFENVNSELFFPLPINTAHLRGHDLKCFTKGVKLNVRKTSSVKGLSMTGINCQKL